MTGNFHFQVLAHSSASPHAVFEKIADGGNWSRWVKPLIRHSEWAVHGTPTPGGVGAVRKLGSKPVFVRERITAYRQDHGQSYTFDSPAPVADYHAEITLTLRADGGTDVEWRGEFNERLPGTGVPMRFLMRWIVTQLASKLLRAAEHAESD